MTVPPAPGTPLDPRLDFTPQLQCEAMNHLPHIWAGASYRCDLTAVWVVRVKCRGCRTTAVYVICERHKDRVMRERSPVSLRCPNCAAHDPDPQLVSVERFLR